MRVSKMGSEVWCSGLGVARPSDGLCRRYTSPHVYRILHAKTVTWIHRGET